MNKNGRNNLVGISDVWTSCINVYNNIFLQSEGNICLNIKKELANTISFLILVKIEEGEVLRKISLSLKKKEIGRIK